MDDKVCIPIDKDLYAEFILRRGRSVDVVSSIENVVRDFLDRTEFDGDIWSEEYIEKANAKLDEKFEATYGDPEGYYQWGPLMLLNGTEIRMTYKGKNYFAFVRDEEIVLREDEGLAYTPSQLASKIAGGTSRNAWRDLWIKERGTNQWVLAFELRSRAQSIRPLTIEDFA